MVQADFSDRDNNPMYGKCQRKQTTDIQRYIVFKSPTLPIQGKSFKNHVCTFLMLLPQIIEENKENCKRTDTLIEVKDSTKNPVLNREPLLTNDFLRAGKEWVVFDLRITFPSRGLYVRLLFPFWCSLQAQVRNCEDYCVGIFCRVFLNRGKRKHFWIYRIRKVCVKNQSELSGTYIRNCIQECTGGVSCAIGR